MANSSGMNFANIARPYALAAFQYAHDEKQLAEWKLFLEQAKLVVENPEMIKVLSNPEISSGKLFELFSGLLKPLLNRERENFLHLIAQNKRLMAIGEIANLFNAYYAYLEKISTVRVVTAIKTPEEFQEKLKRSLSKRVQRDVILQSEVDPTIIGGAIIHIGDRVIDGSIRGKLARLLEFSLR